MTKETIDRKVKEFDDNSPKNAVLRANGIPLIRRGYIEKSSEKFLFGVDKESDKVQKSIEVVQDLDKWAATKQHLICGRPFVEPVRDPEWIAQNYKGLVGKVNYPEQLIRDKMTQSATFWDPNSAAKRKNSRKISNLK